MKSILRAVVEALLVILILTGLAIGLSGCGDASLLALDVPECHTPMPVFQTDPESRPDTIPFVCPYAYVDENGDTVVVVWDPGDLPD